MFWYKRHPIDIQYNGSYFISNELYNSGALQTGRVTLDNQLVMNISIAPDVMIMNSVI